MTDERLLTVEEAAERFGVAEEELLRAHEDGRLPGLIFGFSPIFTTAQVQEFVEHGRTSITLDEERALRIAQAPYKDRRYLSLRELAEYTLTPTSTVKHHQHYAGVARGVQMGRTLVFTKEQADAYLESGRASMPVWDAEAEGVIASQDAAVYLGMEYITLLQNISRGTGPANEKVANVRIFTKKDLDAWIEERNNPRRSRREDVEEIERLRRELDELMERAQELSAKLEQKDD